MHTQIKATEKETISSQVPQLLLIFSVFVLYINFIFNKISILYQLQNGYLEKTHAI